MRVAAYFPITLSNTWHSHICFSLCDGMMQRDFEVSLVAPTIWRDPGRHAFVRPGVPWALNPIAMRADRYVPVSATLGELRYRAEVARSQAAYLWAGVPRRVYEQVKRSGLPLVVERINTHRQTAKRLVEEAYARAGLPAPQNYSERAIAEETEKLELADFVFAPSPGVCASLLEAGVPSRKILSSSYGFCPTRVPPRREPIERPGFTVLFVGMLCVRKGVHVLLEAWKKAAIAGGRLLLYGEIDQGMEKLCEDGFNLPGVEYRGFMHDVARAYAEADVLVLPSVEEGSPLVVYEAMASCVLPVVSPMAAGEIVRDEVEGCVVDPYAVDELATALQDLSEDRERLRFMQCNAARRALDFTWKKVAERRRELLVQGLAGEGSRKSA